MARVRVRSRGEPHGLAVMRWPRSLPASGEQDHGEETGRGEALGETTVCHGVKA
jgi:hypothetical protein